MAIPPFRNTAMDGFAVRAVDTATAPVTLNVIGTIAAGDPGLLRVGTGEAARIMTGAPMPPGSDAVVMVERTRPYLGGEGGGGRGGESGGGRGGESGGGRGGESGGGRGGESGGGRGAEGGAERVIVEIRVAPGNHVRESGEDVTEGEEVFPAGTVLTPGHVGVLASIGAYEVAAYGRPRVGVVSTGDELVDGPGPLRRGQIRDSNRRILLGLVAEAGFEGVDLGIARDDEACIEEVFRRGILECDALLSSGGVSMGDHDYVKSVLDRIGDMRWMQIAIKPAKPFAFGVVDGTPVFGLPGNPVSSMVAFELLAKPAIRAMAGRREDDLGPFTVPAVSDAALTRRTDGKIHYLRVSAVWDAQGFLRVAPASSQGSHQLAAMARADGLAVVPDGDGIPSGALVDVILL